MSNTAFWRKLEFTVCDPELTDWPEAAGLYVFAGLVSDPQGNSRWQAHYIGETGDFADRIPNHENWPVAELMGATHIHIQTMEVENPTTRALMEQDLVKLYQPSLNEQLR